ncbi:MAG: exodeoxyribonuclease VII small subunit [Pseudomonadota bacterium]
MADAPTAPASIASDVSFEAALKELEDIVAALEQGDAELERSIQLYERGAALKAHCEAKLRDAQDKVDRIVLDGGPVRSEPADIG